MEVTTMAGQGRHRRFQNVAESLSAILRFPHDRLATFACSFGAAETGMYEIVGTKDRVRAEPAYEHVGDLTTTTTMGGKTSVRAYKAGDQFAPQLIYFASCIRENRQPEPNGIEGLIDVQIVEALHRAAQQRRTISLRLPVKQTRPRARLQMHRPSAPEPKQVLTHPPTL